MYVTFHTSHQRLKLWYITSVPQLAVVHTYITNVPHLWLAKIFTPFQQEFTVTATLECNYYCCNCIVFLDLQCIFGFMMVFCNHSYCVAACRIISLASQMGIYQLFAMQNSVWLWLTSRISVGTTPFSTAQTRLNLTNVLNV